MADIKMKMGKKAKTEMHKGNLSVSSEEIKEVKDWNIGDKVTMLVEVEVTELRKCDKWEQEEYGLKSDSIKAHTDVKSIKLK